MRQDAQPVLLSAGWGENLEDMQLSALRAALAQLALQKTRSLEICRLAKGELQGGVKWYSRLSQPNSPQIILYRGAIYRLLFFSWSKVMCASTSSTRTLCSFAAIHMIIKLAS